MSRPANYLAGALLAATLAACATQPAKTIDGVYTNQAGMTLYTFDQDSAYSGKSACHGPCAALWPPVAPSGDVSGEYSVITREDGSRQLAFRGKPIYLYAKDRQPGDRMGDGVKGVWHVIFHYYTDPAM